MIGPHDKLGFPACCRRLGRGNRRVGVNRIGWCRRERDAEFVDDLPGVIEGEAFQAAGGSGDVAAESFEPLAGCPRPGAES